MLSGLSDRIFLARFFPQSAAAFSEAQGLLDAIKAAFIRTLEAVPWMDAATKHTAVAKAQKMGVNIGGPAAAYAEAAGAAAAIAEAAGAMPATASAEAAGARVVADADATTAAAAAAAAGAVGAGGSSSGSSSSTS